MLPTSIGSQAAPCPPPRHVASTCSSETLCLNVCMHGHVLMCLHTTSLMPPLTSWWASCCCHVHLYTYTYLCYAPVLTCLYTTKQTSTLTPWRVACLCQVHVYTYLCHLPVLMCLFVFAPQRGQPSTLTSWWGPLCARAPPASCWQAAASSSPTHPSLAGMPCDMRDDRQEPNCNTSIACDIDG
eukprot:1137433-Pelagomonas_calceolata.AAC.9